MALQEIPADLLLQLKDRGPCRQDRGPADKPGSAVLDSVTSQVYQSVNSNVNTVVWLDHQYGVNVVNAMYNKNVFYI